jgi:hypothetical protein
VDGIGTTGNFSNGSDRSMQHHRMASLDAHLAKVLSQFLSIEYIGSPTYRDLGGGSREWFWLCAHDQEPKHEDQFPKPKGLHPSGDNVPMRFLEERIYREQTGDILASRHQDTIANEAKKSVHSSPCSLTVRHPNEIPPRGTPSNEFITACQIEKALMEGLEDRVWGLSLDARKEKRPFLHV